MPKRKPLDLAALDGKKLDGLKFSLKVYDLFDQVRSEPGGLGKTRLLASKREKRLLEELLPIARYLQTIYRPINRIQVQWFSGSQPYDAIIWTPMEMVKHTNIPRKIFVEVTIAQHKHIHLARKQLHETGGTFGPKGIKINKTTGVPDSAPYVNSGTEPVVDLIEQIVRRLTDKAKKSYAPDTVLIINCNTDGLVHEDEWILAIQQVTDLGLHKSFRQVFILDPVGGRSASLWGKQT